MYVCNYLYSFPYIKAFRFSIRRRHKSFSSINMYCFVWLLVKLKLRCISRETLRPSTPSRGPPSPSPGPSPSAPSSRGRWRVRGRATSSPPSRRPAKRRAWRRQRARRKRRTADTLRRHPRTTRRSRSEAELTTQLTRLP